MIVSLGADDEERNFEFFAMLDDGDIDLSEKSYDESTTNDIISYNQLGVKRSNRENQPP